MITLTNLTKRYNGRPVVNNISLRIGKGEIVGLLGPNGAGKTTTLRMIAGVLPASGGQVAIDGEDITKTPSLKSKIGFLPENNPLFDDMTTEEFLGFWFDLKRVDGKRRKELLNFVIRNCGIADVYYRPLTELSKGFQQRVGLAQSILTQPEILILDEPTEGLDPNQRHDIAGLIKSLGESRTVIISSHVLSEITKIASRLVIINNGKIVADDSPDNLRSGVGGETILEVEIKGGQVLPIIKSLKGVVGVQGIGPNLYEVSVRKGLDLREQIFKTAVAKKWLLLGMTAKQKEIEDVFSQLTS